MVVLRGGVHDDKARQQALQLQAHVRLGRGLAATVSGSVQTVGHQLHRRAVNDMDGHFETEGRTAPFARRKARRLFCQVPQGPPEQLFGHRGATLTVGVRKTVAAGRRRAANGGQRPGMQLERVASIVESDTMAPLSIQQAHRVTPRTKRARLIRHASLPRNFGNLVLGNEIANLTQNVKPAACWFDCFLFHPCLVAGQNRQANTFSTSCGLAV